MPPREPFRLVFLMSSSEEAERLASTLRNAGLLIHHTHLDNVQKLEPLLQESWDLILCEAGLEAIQALAIIKEQGRDIPLIILSPEPSSAAIDPLAYGARDVVNPAVKALLVHAVKRELEALEQRRMLDHCQHSLGECEERNRILMDSSRDAIAYIHEGMHIYANTAYLDMFGFMDQDELSGVPLLDLIAPEDVPAFKALLRRYQEKGKAAPAEIHVLHSDGRRLKVTVELSPAHMEGEPCMQIVFRKAQEAAPGEHLDPLTGLYLRPYFLEALSRAVARAQQGKGDSALLFISLDNLPGIRQALGIQASDHLLAEVAQWIKDALPPGATAARFSEDTLAVLTQGGMDDIRAFAENLRRQAEGHVFELLGKTAITTLSIGIALITDQTESADEALRAAESALKEA
ncbi:MAG: GGDEF domain-containing protein, partial [Gammaproteobacteria bacterium]